MTLIERGTSPRLGTAMDEGVRPRASHVKMNSNTRSNVMIFHAAKQIHHCRLAGGQGSHNIY